MLDKPGCSDHKKKEKRRRGNSKHHDKYLDGLTTEDEEVLGAHHEEAHELFAENLLDFIRLYHEQK